MEHHPRSPPEKYYQATSLFPELSPCQKKTNMAGVKEMHELDISPYFWDDYTHVINVCWHHVFHPSNLLVIPKKFRKQVGLLGMERLGAGGYLQSLLPQ